MFVGTLMVNTRITSRITSKFEVEEIVDDQGDVWLEDLNPDRLGLLVAVEINENYSSELEGKIESLKEGEKIKATLESQNEEHTIWHFANIEKLNNNDKKVIHA